MIEMMIEHIYSHLDGVVLYELLFYTLYSLYVDIADVHNNNKQEDKTLYF